jgi:hypothetical protein
MMDWMSRILVGEMAGADEDFGLKVEQLGLYFFQAQTTYRTRQDPHGPDDPSKMINSHHLDISGHDGLDEQDIGWRSGWC